MSSWTTATDRSTPEEYVLRTSNRSVPYFDKHNMRHTAYLIVQKWIDKNNNQKLKFGIYSEPQITMCNGPQIKNYSQTVLASHESKISYQDAYDKLFAVIDSKEIQDNPFS